MKRSAVALAVSALALGIFAARGTAGAPAPTSCDASYNCAKGQTCATTDGRIFACVPAGPGKLGDPCDASAGGSITCGEGLSCLATGAPKKGTCVAWCGGPAGCTGGRTCGAVTTTQGVPLKLCLPCNLAYACGAGQTCATTTGTSFSCVTAGPGRAGDGCDARVNAAITCGERLTCLAFGKPKEGTCVPWCDKTHPCAAGKTCKVVTTTKGAALPVCL